MRSHVARNNVGVQESLSKSLNPATFHIAILLATFPNLPLKTWLTLGGPLLTNAISHSDRGAGSKVVKVVKSTVPGVDIHRARW